MNLEDLFNPFPKEAISWRAQSLTKDGTKAMALAYLDARDVMNRLDEVCGVNRWQCKYTHAGQKTVCDIGIFCTYEASLGGEWVWKADGAGDTDIEAEKGALSDAFKRAAVRWGIGRYLYDLDAPWVPCESYSRGEKFVWSKWKDDPWKYVKTPLLPSNNKSAFSNASLRKTWQENITNSFYQSETLEALKTIAEIEKPKMEAMEASGNEHDALCLEEVRKHYRLARDAIQQATIANESFNTDIRNAR